VSTPSRLALPRERKKVDQMKSSGSFTAAVLFIATGVVLARAPDPENTVQLRERHRDRGRDRRRTRVVIGLASA